MLGHDPSVSRIAVFSVDDSACRRAADLAKEMGLSLVDSRSEANGLFELLLCVGADRLELREVGARGRSTIAVDFLTPTLRRRLLTQKNNLLTRAISRGSLPLNVIDATAGLGRDSISLAAMGCRVMAVERNPILHALLADGLRRAAGSNYRVMASAMERITLIQADSRDVLKNLSPKEAPDIVFVDPMYSPQKKKALPKKEMQLCRRLVGDDSDAAELLDIARGVVRNRVVVKRHPLAPHLAPKPNIEYKSKLVRYDVYLAQR